MIFNILRVFPNVVWSLFFNLVGELKTIIYKMKKNENDITLYAIISAIIILILYFLNYILLKNDFNNRGTFGDMFGASNSLFSGLALAGIIFSILLQRRELKYQRDELIETRKEFNIQNSTLKFQRFENTFFNLLNLHHQIIENIDYTDKLRKDDNRTIGGAREYEFVTIKGRDFFKDKFEILHRKLENTNLENTNVVYLDFYKSLQTDLGHYFRHVYRIIKFVDETEFISKIELQENTKIVNNDMYLNENYKIKYKYISMFRAQLSDYELLWLFYNCISNNGVEKFKPLIEKYSIFKNIPFDKIHNNELIKTYAASAFSNKQLNS